MTFHDWIYSIYPPDSTIDGRWGALHIAVLCAVIIISFCIAIFLRKGSCRARNITLWVLISLLILFELSRRIINFSRDGYLGVNDLLHTLLPRPWCAISCWLMISAAIARKRFLYNLAPMCALICAIIFFAYPSVGFNDRYILFENLYSISTHALLFILSVTLIALGFTDFRYKREGRLGAFSELIGLAAVFLYAFAEIYLLKIEPDPLYFMPDNEVQAFLCVGYGAYLFIYVGFLTVYFNLFYLINKWIKRKKQDL